MNDYPCYIAGQAVNREDKLSVYNPYNGEVAGTVANLGKVNAIYWGNPGTTGVVVACSAGVGSVASTALSGAGAGSGAGFGVVTGEM